MRDVAFLPSLDERIPARSPHMLGRMRLIGLFADDNALVGLVRHLYQKHSIVTVAELDAAGWSVINTYTGRLSKTKLRKFFHTIGRKVGPEETANSPRGRILQFVRPQP
jgi:hypothetical protein